MVFSKKKPNMNVSNSSNRKSFPLEIRRFVPLALRQANQESLEGFPSWLVEKYENLGELAKGVQGKVFKVLERETFVVKAIKCMYTMEPELISQVIICF